MLAERLGHSSTRVTRDTYQHAAADLSNQAAVAIQEAIRGKKPVAKDQKTAP